MNPAILHHLKLAQDIAFDEPGLTEAQRNDFAARIRSIARDIRNTINHRESGKVDCGRDEADRQAKLQGGLDRLRVVPA